MSPTSNWPHPLGTPCSNAATRVLLLGAGELGKEVLIALQRLGVETIAVDRYAGAPGHQVAHRAHVIDMTNAAELLAVIKSERPHIVVPEIEAIATAALMDVEKSGLARVVPTARAVQLTMNREGIRRLAAETLGLPTSAYRFASTFEEAIASAREVGFPCIIKPVMSSSGKGQSRVNAADELPAAWEYANAGGRVALGRVIVEGLVDFDYEITLLTVRALRTRRTHRDRILRTDRPRAGRWRLRRKLAAAPDESRSHWQLRATMRSGSPTISAEPASSASSSSSRQTASGFPRSARGRMTPAW